jgi:hypothetical protein
LTAISGTECIDEALLSEVELDYAATKEAAAQREKASKSRKRAKK